MKHANLSANCYMFRHHGAILRQLNTYDTTNNEMFIICSVGTKWKLECFGLHMQYAKCI